VNRANSPASADRPGPSSQRTSRTSSSFMPRRQRQRSRPVSGDPISALKDARARPSSS
jgi:hypothetical protein